MGRVEDYSAVAKEFKSVFDIIREFFENTVFKHELTAEILITQLEFYRDQWTSRNHNGIEIIKFLK